MPTRTLLAAALALASIPALAQTQSERTVQNLNRSMENQNQLRGIQQQQQFENNQIRSQIQRNQNTPQIDSLGRTR